MEHNEIEVTEIQEALSEAVDPQRCELSDLQLAFVGGGACDTMPH